MARMLSRFVLSALTFSSVAGIAMAAGPAPQRTDAVDAVFLATFSPIPALNGVKYGARLTCGPLEGACISSASINVTLMDDAGTVLATDSGEFTSEDGGSETWRYVTKATGLGAGTYCNYAEVTFVKVDGTEGTVASAEPVCATIE